MAAALLDTNGGYFAAMVRAMGAGAGADLRRKAEANRDIYR